MSVKQSLLAILDQGACYGYQLRAEFDRRTGGTWPLNVGQIYNTLERLERDGLAARGETDDEGHVFWSITGAGRDAVAEWLGSPVPSAKGTRDELAIKLALAATLPGVDLAGVIQTQRRASLTRLGELNRAKYAGAHPDSAEELAWSLVVDSMIFQAEAEVRWLDHTEQRLAMRPVAPLPLDEALPARGRAAERRAAVKGASA
ncbi:PadR family transcriptional regulator [Microbacterium karelineae]|uniref:PadR family transcriptional regulator n=1 Tax=Microbacterium karelineae TaxID=2654283 RepID=UPI0012EA6D7A|nr:PadR family transcriptional regulator [Microbacterium karelineae]